MNPYFGYYAPIPPQMQQQRLNSYEQQFNPYQQSPYNMQQPNMIKCRAVTSFDEAKASMIDLDGSIHVFTDIGNKKIYTKQINLDGTATINTYTLDGQEAELKELKNNESTMDFVRHDELETVCSSMNDRISILFNRIDALSDEMIDRTQPKPSARDTKGGSKK